MDVDGILRVVFGRQVSGLSVDSGIIHLSPGMSSASRQGLKKMD